jgi:hypothetical protein
MINGFIKSLHKKIILCIFFIFYLSFFVVKITSAENIISATSETAEFLNPQSNYLERFLNGEFSILDFRERLIQNNEDYFDSYEVLIHMGEYFLNQERAIHVDDENFTSAEKLILLYDLIDYDNDLYQSYTYRNANTEGMDCDDSNALVHPGATELCNTIDDNCNGQVDEGACECNDGLDNDDDLLFDSEDPGCWSDIRNPLSYSQFKNNEERSSTACFKNSDCGQGKYIQGNVCYYGDVFVRYIDFGCLNGGTGISQCAIDPSIKLIERCMYGCKDGECISKPSDFQPLPVGLYQGINLKDIIILNQEEDQNFRIGYLKSFLINPFYFLAGIFLIAIIIVVYLITLNLNYSFRNTSFFYCCILITAYVYIKSQLVFFN